MPNIKYTYTGKLPYHSSHKIAGKWMDLCLGSGDTVELPDNAEDQKDIRNLVQTGLLVKDGAVKAKPFKPAKPSKIQKPEAEEILNNNSNHQ